MIGKFSFMLYYKRTLANLFSVPALELYFSVPRIDNFRFLSLFRTVHKSQKAVLLRFSGRHTWDTVCNFYTNATYHFHSPWHNPTLLSPPLISYMITWKQMCGACCKAQVRFVHLNLKYYVLINFFICLFNGKTFSHREMLLQFSYLHDK